MSYNAINFTLQANLKKTERFGGKLNVHSSGKRTAPMLYAALPRERQEASCPYVGFRVILGKTIRVDWASTDLQVFFPKKTATESQVVAALLFLFSQV